ncbi:substrate-binding domain-containing protein [Frankia sp. AgKG'84/4]|uniref:substrate-binding domain-containing protein n=1 Tax=Frankia sp. AgKG'84/4 TaxID=573490 RepID=UPI002010A379|nr:substrate-binding domain-containing protein [Frankia sp. AgKG'84/4]
MGFDDAPESAYLIPPLTTVRQDFGALGQQGIALLLDQLDQLDQLDRLDQPDRATGPRQAMLPPALVPRASTAPPPRYRGQQGSGRLPSPSTGIPSTSG